MKKSSFSKTVGTAVTALIVVALIAAAIILSDRTLTDVQRSTLKLLAIICGCSMAYCFIAGEITRNYSQMDKLWSLLPIAYSWVIAIRGGTKPRLIAFALIVTVWGIRLTVNFARKGAYRLRFWEGNEDYRWSIVRSSPFFKHGIAWTLFDLFFISFYQNALVLAICLPALACMESTMPFAGWDIAAAALALLFLVLETVSDEYQWRFHRKKNALLEKRGELSALPMPFRLGFNTTGPWACMRHPNYLGEQGMWLSLYLFVIGAGAASCGIFNLSMIGPLLLILLFMGSSALGEKISSGKYPKYADYMEQVFKYLPLRRFRDDG